MKKSIFTILLVAITFISVISILFAAPRKANAIFGIGDISIDPVQIMKEWVLDQLPKTIARTMVVRLQQEIARWAQGGFTDENKPFAMTSWKQEVKNALQVASSRFTSEYNLTPLCSPFKLTLGTMLGINMPVGSVPYEAYGACTLQNVVDNVEDFYKNPSIAMYGWDTWTALAQPNNNILGSYLRAQAEKTRLENEEITEVEKEVEAGQGIKNETICTLTDQQQCAADCNQYPPDASGIPNPLYVACMSSCEKSSIGVCLQKTIKKLGSEIKTSVDKAIGSDIDWLLSADEITEMINLVFSGLFNKLTHGINGMLTKGNSSTTTISKNQAEYGYYKEYKKTQTPEDITKLKGDILTNILKSIQNVSAAGYACDKDEQIKGEIYSEVVADILNEESQHLYTSMEGINLKPDFEVLDTQIAVNNGYAIYGRTWNDIPFNKYPEKCASIANKKCIDIKTGLPYELDLQNINGECTAGCLEQINNYRAECLNIFNECVYNCEDETCKTACHAAHATCYNAARIKAVNDQKCSSITVADACLNGQTLISTTKDRCNECVKKYDESCALMENKKEKDDCIKEACGNYSDISSSIKSAQDFYSRCALNEIKYACDVCLKEYFMPADYCGEVYDYVERAFVKYPALVYEDIWWGHLVKFEDCAVSASIDGKISTALTCRILPDFVFPGGKTCKDFCAATEEELRNTVDGKPTEADCNGPLKDPLHPEWGGVWASGGYPAGSQFGTYMVNKKTACCAMIVGHDKQLYDRCRGISSETTTKGICNTANTADLPGCFCEEGERYIDEAMNYYPNPFPCPEPSGFCWGSNDYPQAESCRKGCGNLSFTVPDMKYINEVIVTTSPAPGGGIVAISNQSCSDSDQDSCWAGGDCDKIGDAPDTDIHIKSGTTNPAGGDLCKMETYHSSNSQSCCTAENTNYETRIGRYTMYCDLSSRIGETLNLSITADDASDCKDSAFMCVRCDPSDPGYPNYGYQTNQCDNKIPGEYRY